jgi:hypothetical protein
MNNLSVLSRLVGIGSWSESVAKRGAWIVAVTLLFFAPFFSPSPAMADQPGNWNLDDGAGHRLGAMLFERSDINTPSGLRLRLNAESGGLQLNHLRPLVLSDDQSQAWQLSNRSEELLTSPGGVIPVGSSQFDAGCLDPIPAGGLSLVMVVPSSEGDLSFDLAPCQVQSLHSLTDACTDT